MKHYIITILLIGTVITTEAQLPLELAKLTQKLTQLTSVISAKKATPQNIPPITAWAQFLHKNSTQEQRAQQTKYPIFSGVVTVTAHNKYTSLHNLHAALQVTNKSCANFYPIPKLHMTMLYFNIPIAPDKYEDESAMVGKIADYITQAVTPYKAILHSLSFTYDTTKIIGANQDFLVATFNPTQSMSNLQNNFILPFANQILANFPDAWISHISNLAFHISLAKLQPNCTAQNIKFPLNLPKVESFELSKGLLRVSVKGPTSKPYWKIVP